MRFNGFVNYLAKFLLKLSEVTEPIRQLTRKDVPWNWSASQENAFVLMKELGCVCVHAVRGCVFGMV